MYNVANYLDAAARRCPDAIALVHNGRRLTYRELHELASRIANGLIAEGFGPSDRIALCCSNRPGFIAAYYGILKIGGIAILHTTSLRHRDIISEMRDSKSRALFVFDGYGDTRFANMAVEAASRVDTCERIWIVPPDPMEKSTVEGFPSIADLMADQSSNYKTIGRRSEDTAVVLYTSGTNGHSKGVEITHLNLMAMVMINLPLVTPGVARVRLVVTPLYHILGQVFCLNLTMLSAETMVLAERFDPEVVWRLITEEGVTQIVMLPIFYRLLLDHADQVDAAQVRKTLRLCGTGGAPLPAMWSHEFEEHYGIPIVPGYGMTETTGIITWHCPTDPLKLQSVGRPVPGVDVCLVGPGRNPVPPGSEGEILVRSPGVMKGYLGLREVTAEVLSDGWFRTSDSGVFDEDGYLYIRGHLGGMIIRGTEHIYPAEVENALHEHPLVARAAVIPVPDDILGQEAKTLVELKKGCSIGEDELLSWMIRKIPEGKCPGIVNILPALPLTDTGKVARHLLARA